MAAISSTDGIRGYEYHIHLSQFQACMVFLLVLLSVPHDFAPLLEDLQLIRKFPGCLAHFNFY